MPDKSAVGAFYLKEKEPVSYEDLKKETLRQKIEREFNSIKAGLKEKILDFDAKEFAKNFAAQCPSAFVMKYATAILTNIANGRAVKFDALLDILFIDLAPMMKQTQLFLGFMSYDKFRLALKNNSGKVNIIGLLDGMNFALRTMQNEKKIKELENQYEEMIPIDLIESCTLSYIEDNISFVKPADKKGMSDLMGAKKVGIKLVGHMKNLNGNFTKSNDYIQKLERCMAFDKEQEKAHKDEFYPELGQVTLRVGSDIYEHCLIKSLDATISSPAKEGGGAYDMKITVELLYNVTHEMETEPNGLTKVNPYQNIGVVGDFYPWTRDMC